MRPLALATFGLLALAACGGATTSPHLAGLAPSNPATLPASDTRTADQRFADALEGLETHDAAHDWSPATCDAAAKDFASATDRRKTEGGAPLAAALYDAGLVYLRCQDATHARVHLRAAVALDARQWAARSVLVLLDADEKGTAALDASIAELARVVIDSDRESVDALVGLARLEMLRDGATVDATCNAGVAASDFDCARVNLEHAIAVDGVFMPAKNQLALYYVAHVKRHRESADDDLRRATLLCEDAIGWDARYASMHNTAGVILGETGAIAGAIGEFSSAAQLDPSLFEAYMNLGASNLSFHGFDMAQRAYQKAVVLRPNDYDAHLGLAIAYRGQITDRTYDQEVASAIAELDACVKLDPGRPEAYFDKAVLAEDYLAPHGGSTGAAKVYSDAVTLFQTFIQKATGQLAYDAAVKAAKDSLADIADPCAGFLCVTAKTCLPANDLKCQSQRQRR